MNEFKEKDAVLDDINNILSKKYFNISLEGLYKYNLTELYDLIKKNTLYLESIPLDEIEKIEIIDPFMNTCVLTKKGNLYIDGNLVNNNIRDIGQLFRIGLFAISNDNEIIFPLFDGIEKFTKNIKFKKIIVSSMKIVGLTDKKEIKVIGFYDYVFVDKMEITNVDDIGYVSNSNKIVSIKKKKAKEVFQESYFDINKDVCLIDDYKRI